MSSKFKSIIFLYVSNDKSNDLKLIANSLKGVTFFETRNIEEVMQILEMSDKSCIISDDITNILIAHEKYLRFTKAKHKIYVLDWGSNFSTDELETLQTSGISLLKESQFIGVVELIQAYLMGKITTKSSDNYDRSCDLTQTAKHFITIIEVKDELPQIIVSTHEQFEDINQLLGESWDNILHDGINSISENTPLKEGKLQRGDFYQIVVDINLGTIKRLALVHIFIDSELKNNIQKIKSFLLIKMKELT